MSGNEKELKILADIRAKISACLDQIIPAGARIAIADFPRSQDIGNSLAYLGLRKYLKERNARIVYSAGIFEFKLDELMLSKPTLLVFMGSQESSDRDDAHQVFLERTIEKLRDLAILQLSGGTDFTSAWRLRAFLSVARSHPNFTLLVEDQSGYAALADSLPKVALCPGLPFYAPMWEPRLLKQERSAQQDLVEILFWRSKRMCGAFGRFGARIGVALCSLVARRRADLGSRFLAEGQSLITGQSDALGQRLVRAALRTRRALRFIVNALSIGHYFELFHALEGDVLEKAPALRSAEGFTWLWFTCGRDAALIAASLASFIRTGCPWPVNIVIAHDKKDPLSESQKEALTRIAGQRICFIRTPWPFGWIGLDVVKSEIAIFRALARVLGPEQFIVKVDSDVLFSSQEFFHFLHSTPADLVGQDGGTTDPRYDGRTHHQGGMYACRSEVFQKIKRVDLIVAKLLADFAVNPRVRGRLAYAEDCFMSGLLSLQMPCIAKVKVQVDLTHLQREGSAAGIPPSHIPCESIAHYSGPMKRYMLLQHAECEQEEARRRVA